MKLSREICIHIGMLRIQLLATELVFLQFELFSHAVLSSQQLVRG